MEAELKEPVAKKETDLLNILLIDDDEDDSLLFRDALKEASLQVQLLYGQNSELLFVYIDAARPDIIFLDINMPGKNGMQCLQQLKANDKYKHIPVIMYSVANDVRIVGQAYELGAHRYLVKPYSEHTFPISLKKVLGVDWKTPQPMPKPEEFLIDLEFR
jgi:PleD family two-component response regulator